MKTSKIYYMKHINKVPHKRLACSQRQMHTSLSYTYNQQIRQSVLVMTVVACIDRSSAIAWNIKYRQRESPLDYATLSFNLLSAAYLTYTDWMAYSMLKLNEDKTTLILIYFTDGIIQPKIPFLLKFDRGAMTSNSLKLGAT